MQSSSAVAIENGYMINYSYAESFIVSYCMRENKPLYTEYLPLAMLLRLAVEQATSYI